MKKPSEDLRQAEQLLRAMHTDLEAARARSSWSGENTSRGLAAPLRCRPFTLSEAERELMRVHRIEQARLLRAAALLRAAESVVGRLYAGAKASGRMRERWRADCVQELRSSAFAGLIPLRMLQRCCEKPIGAWDAASVLARASLDLEGCDEGRLQLARAHIAEGRADAAQIELEGWLQRAPGGEFRARMLELDALACQLQGEVVGALSCFECATREPRASLLALVSTLVLSLSTGDLDRARAATLRLACLDLSIRGVERRFHAVVEETRERLLRSSVTGGVRLSKVARRFASTLMQRGPMAPARVASSLL